MLCYFVVLSLSLLMFFRWARQRGVDLEDAQLLRIPHLALVPYQGVFRSSPEIESLPDC